MPFNTHLRKLKLILKGLLNHFFYIFLRHRGFNPDQSILIFGTSRSGSTWLAEILSSLNGHLQIFEPLHPQYVRVITKTLPKLNYYVPASTEWPDGFRLFKKILSGKLVNPWILSQATPLRIIRSRRLVIKIVRGNLLLEWIARNIAGTPPVLVIRHPCAVIASQLTKGWRPARWLLINNPYLDNYPEIRKQCNNFERPEQFAALAWCVRYHAPLMAARPYPFILVCYERLVRNGAEELERLFKALDIKFNKKIIARLSRPSDTSTRKSQIVTGKDPLSGWKSQLKPEQVSNILSVLKIFNMDFYTDDMEPDYQKLMAFGTRPNDG